MYRLIFRPTFLNCHKCKFFMIEKLKFPEGFLWGAGTSSHQVEGNTKNDWTKWEEENYERLATEAKDKWESWQQEKFPEMFESQNYISGAACEHYNRFSEDFDFAKEMSHNAHRFSIEWSRIEPEEGKFDEKEIEHYRKVILALKERGMEPFVTLWHWTEPIWFGEMGAWTNRKSQDYFLRFVEKVVGEYGNIVNFWVVINEPNVYIGFGYLLGHQPPGRKNLLYFLRAYFNLLAAYKKSYKIIHSVNENSKVGFAHSFMQYEAKIFRPVDELIVSAIKFFSDYFFRKTKGCSDFIGCNYYTRMKISFGKKNISFDDITDLGWEIYPEGIYQVMKGLKKYNLPIYVTENGLADSSDSKRERFIKSHLYWLHRAIEDGIDVKGYMYWSLLDNFEFPEVRGFWPRFGLIEVDYKTQTRSIRKSALEYAKICRSNEVEIDVDAEA